MAEFEFVQVKITFDNKLEIAGALVHVSLISAALQQWPLSNCSLLCQKMKHLVAAASDREYTVLPSV